MGGGASSLVNAIEKDPEAYDAYREELASLFAREYVKFRDEGISEEEAKKKIMDRVKKEELSLIKQATKVQQPGLLSSTGKFPQLEVRKAAQSARLMSKKSSLKFVCCIDGSDGSDMVLIVNFIFKV